MMRLVRTFGDNVRDILLARVLKGKDLAAKMDVGPDRISRWLDSDNVELLTIFKFAKGLEVTVETLCAKLDPEYDEWRDRRGTQDLLMARIPELTEKQQRALLVMLEAILPSPGSSQTPPPAEQG